MNSRKATLKENVRESCGNNFHGLDHNPMNFLTIWKKGVT